MCITETQNWTHIPKQLHRRLLIFKESPIWTCIISNDAVPNVRFNSTYSMQQHSWTSKLSRLRLQRQGSWLAVLGHRIGAECAYEFSFDKFWAWVDMRDSTLIASGWIDVCNCFIIDYCGEGSNLKVKVKLNFNLTLTLL